MNWILTVALSALVAWSRLKPMETMVARCSSERLSVGVVPGPELQPGNTRGAAKSAANHTEENMSSEPSTLTEDFLSGKLLAVPYTPGSSIWLMVQFMAASIPVLPV